MMERIRAPWRSQYVEGVAGDDAPECFLCAAAADGGQDRTRGVVARWPAWFAILNAYPYTSGHLMLALGRHAEGFGDLEASERQQLPEAMARCEAAVRAAYRPDGLNVGVNLGRVAGAGVVGHLHVHFVPRWSGDTNFMTAVAEARVLPESLERSYERLAAAFASLEAP